MRLWYLQHICMKVSLHMLMLTYPTRHRGLKFGQSLHLHSYFVYASNEGSGESAHLHSTGGKPRNYHEIVLT